MITVSDDVKKLFTAGNLKNYRIHFKESNLPDLTLKDYVSETFQFSESISSGNSLDFGTIEIPTFSVSVYNMGNVKNEKVTLTLEYFCGSEIDGAVYQKDIDSYVYQFPMGDFVIESCNIDSTKKNIRKLTAYGSALYDYLSLRNDYQAYLNGAWFSNKTNVRLYIDDINDIYFYDENLITDIAAEKTILKYPDLGNYLMKIEGAAYEIGTLKSTGFSLKNTTFWRTFNYYKFKGEWTEYLSAVKEFYNNIIDFLDENEIEYDESIKRYLLPIEYLEIPTSYIYESVTYSGNSASSYTIQGDFDVDTKQIKTDKTYSELSSETGVTLYISLNYTKTESNTKWNYYEWATDNCIYIPKTLTVTIGETTFTGDFSQYIEAVYTYRKTKSSKLENSDTVFKVDLSRNVCTTVKGRRTAKFDGGTGEFKSWTSTNVKRKEYTADASAISSASIRTIMQSYAELQGKMGKIGRSGGFQFKQMNGTVADTIPMADYYTFGYDEIEVKKIGKITLNYQDIDEDGSTSVITKNLVDNYDSNKYVNYIVSDNWILSNGQITQEQAEEIINTMAANMAGIAYIPCTLNMIARPDLETGDFIEVQTDSGSFKTCIMKRTLSGIVALKDKIECNDNDGDSIGIGGSVSTSSVVSGSTTKTVNISSGSTSEYYVSDVTCISDTEFTITVTNIADETQVTNNFAKTESDGVVTITNKTNGYSTTFQGW